MKHSKLENKTTGLFSLKPVFQALPGLYMLLTPEFIILEITDQYLHSTNSNRDALLHRNIVDTLQDVPQESNPQTQVLLEASLQHAAKYKEPHTMAPLTFYIPGPGNEPEERYWQTVHTPILSPEGELLYLLHETRDITEQVRLEQEKKHSQERLTLLTSALDAVAWEYDIVHNRMHWGEGLQEVFGYTPEQMGPGGESWDDRVHPQDFPAIRDSITQATASGSKVWSGEYRFRKADGTYAEVLDQGYIIYDRHGKAIRTIGSIIDLSKSKRAQEHLQESEARFRHLLEALPHMAWTADPKGRVLFYNQHWYSYTGMQQGQTEGWVSVIHPEDVAAVLTTWNEALTSGNLYELEYRLHSSLDGSYRWFLDRGLPLRNADGVVELWIGTYTDIEEQKQAIMQMELKDQQLENILRLSPAHLCLLHGPNHVCRYVTPGVYKLYGYRPYLGRPAREIWPELQHMGFLDLLNQVYERGDTVQLTELKVPFDRYQNGQPQDAFFNFKYQPLLTTEGESEGVLISAIEVTELVETRRKAEALARNSGTFG